MQRIKWILYLWLQKTVKRLLTVIVYSVKRKTSPHVLILKLTNKLDLRIGEKIIALSNLAFATYGKTLKAHTITINLKYLH